jgi:hypothetical protein
MAELKDAVECAQEVADSSGATLNATLSEAIVWDISRALWTIAGYLALISDSLNERDT